MLDLLGLALLVAAAFLAGYVQGWEALREAVREGRERCPWCGLYRCSARVTLGSSDDL